MERPVQKSLTNPYPSKGYDLTAPTLGIILEVRQSDHPDNRSSRESTSFRGVVAEATVYCVTIGTVLPNVIITPNTPSGMDDFEEHLPRPCKNSTILGKTFSLAEFDASDPSDLDGDWCIVDFIDGNLQRPYIQRWWPSPRNYYDAATTGKGNPVLGAGTGLSLKQGKRWFKRTNGVELVLTEEGDIWVSTKLAKSVLTPALQLGSTDRVARRERTGGGSILVQMKLGSSFDLTFDPHPDGVGPDMVGNPALPQRNPNPIGVLPVPSAFTSVHFDKTGVSFKVPVNFKVESKISARVSAKAVVELNASLMRLGDAAVQPPALALDTLAAIVRLEAAVLSMTTAITAYNTAIEVASGKAAPLMTDTAAATLATETGAALTVLSTALLDATSALSTAPTVDIAAKKVIVE